MRLRFLFAGGSLIAATFAIAAPAQVAAPSGVSPSTPPAAGSAEATPSARDTSDDIIVTAQRRAERTQDVPISITNIGAAALTQANVQNLGEIVKLTPALRFDYAAAFAQPTIRGVGTAVATSGGGANVGIYVDGFYSPNPLVADFQLLNTESVQVLKGPQGTLFGRNTTGGAILITTAKPSTTTKAIVEGSYGSYDTRRIQAYATTGLSEKVAIDLEGLYRAGDGFVKNTITGSDKGGRFENWSVRAGLNVDLTEDVSFLLRYAHADVNDRTNLATNIFTANGQTFQGSAVPASLIATRYNRVSSTDDPRFRNKTDTVQLTGSADLDFATLTSYTQYRKDKTRTIQDLDQTAAPVFLISIPVVDRTITQELLLSSKPGGRLQYTAGLFYFDYTDAFTPITASFGGLPFVQISASKADTKSYAAYLDLTYQFGDHLFLTGGARYSHDTVKGQFFNGLALTDAPVDVKNDRVTPRAVLRYELNPASSVYASFTRGYKAAILDLADTTPARIAPEKIDAYEVGYKYATRAFSFDAAAYYYDYKDLQVSSYANGLAFIDNAATSRIYGLEAQARYQVTRDFEVSAAGAYLHAEYRRFPTSTRYERCDTPAFCGPITGFFAAVPFDASGLRMQRSPKFTGNVAARYALDLAGGRLALSGNLYHTSSFFFDLSEQFRQKSYEILGLRAEWTDPSQRFTFAVYGDNVTDSHYRTQVQYNSYGIGSVFGYPATIGVSARARY